MDIFTTQLTRVQPQPIKPRSLKVRALSKDAASPKLKEDHDHLENHDCYFDNKEKKAKKYLLKNSYPSTRAPDGESEQAENAKEVEQEDKTIGKDKHLDLYA